MPNAFEAAGAEREPSQYAPLTMDRYITGMVTNRSALRDADVPYLQAKFYSAGRFDSIWDGLNVEVSARSTLIRRPGNSVYNSATFPAIKRFYDFRTVVDGMDVVHVMADTAAAVYDATGPSTKLNIWSKAPGGGATCFQSVGNTLYFSNLLENKKWMRSGKAWAPGKVFQPGDFIVDPNNNIQLVPSQKTANIAQVGISGGVATVFLQGPDEFAAGSAVTLSGLTTATGLNGQTLTPSDLVIPDGFQAPTNVTDRTLAPDTGVATSGGGAAVTGSTQPQWATSIGTATLDGGVQWICWGNSVQNWAIAAPTVAPSVVQTALPSAGYPAWSASTTYSTSLSVVDTNGNVQLLVQGGVTGTAEPAWNPTLGQITPDGTAAWKNVGDSTWAAGANHSIGDLIQVTFTYYVTTYNTDEPTGVYDKGTQTPVTETDFFQCTGPGVSGAYTPAWRSGVGVTVQDGAVTWTNTGTGTTWDATVGDGATVSLVNQILDSNGNFQNLTTSGKSGAAVPTWETHTGNTTPDGTAVWTTGASYSAKQTAVKYWAFAYKCSIDDTTSTVSPLSSPLAVGANQIATLQGACSADPQTDTIVIYATDQGGSTLQELDEIPQPAGATWTYNDTSGDAGLTLELQGARNHTNDPPPLGITCLSFHIGRIFAGVNNLVYWCTGPDATVGNGFNAWSPSNVDTYPDSVKRLIPVTVTNGALFVFTVSDLYAIFGDGTASNVFQSRIYGAGIGLLNHDAIDIIGSTIHLFTTARKQVSLDPSSGYTEPGFGIGDQFKQVTTGGISATLYNPASTYVTWHESESADTGLYVADGSVGWFRYSPVSVPETGFLWSPRAAIEGGTSAVKSVETSPGLKSLLIGPKTSGPILMRDLGVNSDADSPYGRTYAVLGSIQLCQPFEECEVAGVVLDSIRIGTAPTIGILYGEIGPTSEVPFDMYEKTTNDPPNLPASTTLFNDRFTTLQNGNPTLCRHMQLLVLWSPEDAASELLTHTIYGAKHSERKQQ